MLEAIEVFEAIKALSAIAVAFAAWFGVLAWKQQAVGKRKVEVAEEALTALNEIAEKFSVFRVLASTADPELESLLKDVGSRGIPRSREITLNYNITKWLVPHFERVNSVRPLAQTYFGAAAIQPFTTLREAISSLKISAMKIDGDELDRVEFLQHMKNIYQGDDQGTECSILLKRMENEADLAFGTFLRKR